LLTVVTTCTPEYQKPWVFPSLGMLTCRVVALLDPEDRRPLPRGAERAAYRTPGVLYQDGRFLDAVPGLHDDDVVVLADADGVFQRDFDASELDTLDNLRGGFALGYNMHPGQRGEYEYRELRPKQGMEEAAPRLGVGVEILKGCWVYNTGLMAAKVGVWKGLRAKYAERFGAVDGGQLFRLHSWPQYLICLTLALGGVPVTELGYDTHSQGHFPLTPKHHAVRRQLYYSGKLVLYAHNILGVSH
jgi:hypothetical protein